MSEIKPYLQLDLNRVRENVSRFKSAVDAHFRNASTQVYYAMKAQPDSRVLRALEDSEIGFEVMTASQLQMVQARKRPYIVSGFHKPDNVIRLADKADYLVVESPKEISRLGRYGFPFKVVLRLKLNENNKIGFGLNEIRESITAVENFSKIKVIGLHFHLGWNIREESLVCEALKKMKQAYFICKNAGVDVRVINLGGSFCEAKSDQTQLDHRLRLYYRELGELPVDFHFEPGRYIVGDAGILYCQIIHMDSEKHTLHVNTCAYGYKLNAGTPRAHVLSPESKVRKSWKVYGLWSAEGDCCMIELEGEPLEGSIFAFENMGAYVSDMPFQFEPDQGIETRFVGEMS